ncbi:hypothetical protein BTO06_02200 [Tenacibaculum sp. SZ-18]|uniref:response regulator n=1 Tax=Tenacibaculum sp. SZ-18 TaxID=754423 RepID=UPI000C2D4CB4|nr:response regulator [Tenacibaculum sp. SZ-18]AUC14041.1 hypothetical protein BTO06_02200 [Tenacibaculum sp. SZ-18]
MAETRILIIEDNVITLNDMKSNVTRMGYDFVETALSGEEAIAIAKTFKPQLILADINLGKGITGIETSHEINKSNETPVIYITAYDDEETLQKAGITSPYAYILKPFKERELQIAIDIAIYKFNIQKQLKDANKQLNTELNQKENLLNLLKELNNQLKTKEELLNDRVDVLLLNNSNYLEQNSTLIQSRGDLIKELQNQQKENKQLRDRLTSNINKTRHKLSE